MLLLRSVVAPVLLVLSVVLSYAVAMGVSAFVFNNILGFPGADATVPLFGFVFLVALGVDYNIFLMSRVREESLKHGTRPGVLRGMGVTGGVITSAGVVLAATSAALGGHSHYVPGAAGLHCGFRRAAGHRAGAFAAVPALAYDIGPKIRCPGKPGRLEADAGPQPGAGARPEADLEGAGHR